MFFFFFFYCILFVFVFLFFFFFQAEDGIRDFCLSRGLGDVYKRQAALWLAALRHSDAILIFHPRLGGAGGQKQAAGHKTRPFRIFRRKTELVVLVNFLAALVAFLRFDGEGRDRARIEPLEQNGFAGLFAKSVRAVVETAQCRIDFGDQLALTGAGAKVELAFSFRGSTIREVGEGRCLRLQVQNRLAALAQDIFFPNEQFAAEIFALPFIHERLAFRWLVAGRKFCTHETPQSLSRPCRAGGFIQVRAAASKWNCAGRDSQIVLFRQLLSWRAGRFAQAWQVRPRRAARSRQEHPEVSDRRNLPDGG